MNPAALKVNLEILRDNGIIIANRDSFQKRNLELAGYETNPLDDGSLKAFQVFPVDITTLTREALKKSELSVKDKDRAKNFFALGITYWLFSRSMKSTIKWLKEKFKSAPQYLDANLKALNAGYSFALSTEMFVTSYKVAKAHKKPGKYRNITGNEGIALGLIAAAQKAKKELFLGSYPITPASDILHELSKYRNFGVKTFQAEDEIAGIGSALGAAYAGALGATTTSGPGLALKTEFMGLAVMMEVPLVIVNIQRGGPSTGLPTKTEQADLLQAVYGRNGEAPIPVIASNSPADCFRAAFEAVQVAFKYTTPVILLSDGYLANGAEPWRIPDVDSLADIEVKHATDPENFKPYKRDPETLARMVAIPGTPGLEHHLGGLEKNESGNVDYRADNHDSMIRQRAEKVNRVGDIVKEPSLMGPEEGELLIVSWGSTYGAIFTVMEDLMQTHKKLAWYHLRWVNPLPKKLGQIIHNYKKVLVPEINLGQLSKILRSEYLVDVKGFNKIRGLPLSTRELKEAIEEILKG
jgi:2-oxoglutarate ferredoxin oxidoreductase subunit alpha